MKQISNRYLKSGYSVLKEIAADFSRNNVMKYSAALSYYTIFSIAPMLLLIIAMASIIYGKEAIEGQLFAYIKNVVGSEAAAQIQELIKNVTLLKSSFLATAIGIATFFLGATSVFGEIQSTINTLWGLKAKPKKGIVRYVVNRLLSFAMVLTIGFLLIVSMVASTLIDVLNQQLMEYLPNTGFLVITTTNLISILIITTLFTLVFKYLPDSLVRWRDAVIGAGFTSLLFLLGKYGIGLYLESSSTHNAFGAAGSLIIILLWIYYSSILLYIGALFTKVYATQYGHGILPNKFSVRVKTIETVIDFDDQIEVKSFKEGKDLKRLKRRHKILSNKRK
jgi:membrane protein